MFYQKKTEMVKVPKRAQEANMNESFGSKEYPLSNGFQIPAIGGKLLIFFFFVSRYQCPTIRHFQKSYLLVTFQLNEKKTLLIGSETSTDQNILKLVHGVFVDRVVWLRLTPCYGRIGSFACLKIHNYAVLDPKKINFQ